MTVYRGYDQRELDRQYDVRSGIPDHQAIFDRWERTSATFRAAARSAHGDLAYGDDPLQRLDLFKAGEPGAPLVVFIHGGYWQSLDKALFSFIAEPYNADGLDVALVNYRLTPAVGMDEVVSDCRQAFVWLWNNASLLGHDRARTVVTGSSAGGHLTAVMASTDWQSYGLPADAVRGACALSGLYDLEPIRLCYLNAKIGLDAESARRNGSVHMVPEAGPPLVLSAGGDETAEFHRQEADYADRWRAGGLACRRIPQRDGHHFDMVDRLGTRGSDIYDAVQALAGRPSP